MGRPNNNNEQAVGQIQSAITHFSHPHPLHVFGHAQILTRVCTACSACKVGFSPGGGTIYGCTTCSFYLHATCSKLPQQIKHPVDPIHALVLLPTPIYPQGFFNCNACKKHGNSFSYHCGACDIDLHTNCASMPLTRTYPAHPHQLSLAFSAPYPGNVFACDVCGTSGKGWLYRCNPCGFDTHLLCARSTSPQSITVGLTNQYPNPGNNATGVSAPKSFYTMSPMNPIAQNLIQQQRVAVAYSQPVSAFPRGNIQANFSYFRGGNRAQGLFSRVNGLLGNAGGGCDAGGMSAVGNGVDGSLVGDGGGGGLDLGSGFSDFGSSFGGIDIGSLGGMDPGSLGDLGGGLEEFSF